MSKQSFNEFINENNQTNSNLANLPAELVKNSSIAISNTILKSDLTLTKDQADEFSSKVIEIAFSKEVIDELSTKIGKPTAQETEAEFIQRSSNTLKSILLSKFNVKT